MKRITTTIAGTAILCLGALIGGFQLGSHHQAAKGGHAASGPAVTTGSSQDNAANHSSKDARSSRNREAAPKPPTVKQILAKVNASMRGGSMQNPASMMRVMGLLDKIRPEDVQEALAEAEAMTDPQVMAVTGMFQSALFDDDKRLRILEKVDALPDEAERKQAKQMMLGQWAMLAPEQAVEWVRTQPQTPTPTCASKPPRPLIRRGRRRILRPPTRHLPIPAWTRRKSKR